LQISNLQSEIHNLKFNERGGMKKNPKHLPAGRRNSKLETISDIQDSKSLRIEKVSDFDIRNTYYKTERGERNGSNT